MPIKRLLLLPLLACLFGNGQFDVAAASPTVDSSGSDSASRSGGRGMKAAGAAPKTSADVIVIGAGMAGMAAARDVAAKLGAASVIVLEGRTRVGGRCWTQELPTKTGKVPIDVGAGWIHGIDATNPMLGLTKAANVALASKVTDYDNTVLYLPTGAEASAAQGNKWDDLFGEFEDFVAQQQDVLEDSGKDPGVGSLATKFIASKKLAGLDRLAFLQLLNTGLEHEYGAPVASLSLFYDNDSAEDGDDKFVVGGYQRVVEFLAKGIDVRLGHKVTKIDSSSPSGLITITTAGKGTFTAKKVVVAVPLGVMQRNAIAFAPALPAANLKALGMLGMGLLNKLVMVFDSVFWEDSTVEVLNRISPGGNGAWQETYSLQPILGQPILVAFNAATYAQALEKKSAQAVKDEFLAAMRTIFRNVPEPRSYNVTAWGSDEFAYGSYSYTKAPVNGGTGFQQAHLDCAKPVANNRIFFAGEHTRTDYPATTHGAFMSGQKAAKDLLAAPASG